MLTVAAATVLFGAGANAQDTVHEQQKEELSQEKPSEPNQNSAASLIAELKDLIESRANQNHEPKHVSSLIETLQQSELSGPQFDSYLPAIAEAVAAVDDKFSELLALCLSSRGIKPADWQWLPERDWPPHIKAAMELYVAQLLIRRGYYDEANQLLEGISPELLPDQSALLFCQAVANHQLLKKKQALEAARALLGLPYVARRYKALAELIVKDLENFREESLEDISRRMKNVSRYLSLGRADDDVKRRQQEIVELLDKLIKQLERQQRQGGASGNLRPSSPAPDSRVLRGKGQGEVDQKAIGNQSGWGNLPPKQREEILQEIGQQFPAHYREVIEQYFRRLANEPAP